MESESESESKRSAGMGIGIIEAGIAPGLPVVEKVDADVSA